MDEEEPMELSGDRGRNGSFFHGNHNSSLSDMDVDISNDMSFSTGQKDHFSFQALNATIATSSPYKKEAKYLQQSDSTETLLRMRSLITKNDYPEVNKTRTDMNLNSLKDVAEKLINDKRKGKKSRPQKKEMSPRESRINHRKSGNGRNVTKQIYLFFFLLVMFVLFTTFIIIHQKCNIHLNVETFEHVFDQNVFGQHIAKFALSNTLRNITKRMQNDTKLSTNPLVFSFHGWTGVGKNFVTKQLLFGFENARVTTFLVPLHFSHQSEDEKYKRDVEQWIKGNITLCYVNIFVFDEMDKATPGLLDGLIAVMEQIRSIEMEKTWIIFLFLSNARGHQINNFLFTEMSRGKKRSELTFDEVLPVLTQGEINNEWYNDFHKRDLIDTFVPFLPLNKHHVQQCIEKDLLKKGRQPSAELIDLISDEMHYIQPISDGEFFSLTGCKRVSDKVDIIS